jgi:hypothetical protein
VRAEGNILNSCIIVSFLMRLLSFYLVKVCVMINKLLCLKHMCTTYDLIYVYAGNAYIICKTKEELAVF